MREIDEKPLESLINEQTIHRRVFNTFKHRLLGFHASYLLRVADRIIVGRVPGNFFRARGLLEPRDTRWVVRVGSIGFVVSWHVSGRVESWHGVFS